MKYPLVVMILLVINKTIAENTEIGDCSVQGDSPGLVFSLACFDLKMWRYFPGVSKTHNKKVVKETPQKADAKDYEKKRSTKRRLSSLKRTMTVLEMMTRAVSDYESDAEMPKK